MSSFFADFEFLRPYLLWLLPILFLLYFLQQKSAMFSSSWEKICDRALLQYLLKTPQKLCRKWFSFLSLLTLFLVVFAAAGPSFEKRQIPVLARENPVMFVLNLSADMNRTDIRPSRLARAKIEIRDVLRTGAFEPTGLVVYTNEPFLISPLSLDSQLIINLLRSVQTDIMPSEGNRLDRAVNFALQHLKQGGYFKGNIVVFTSTAGEDFNRDLDAVREARNEGISVSFYALDIAQNDNLINLAKEGGGVYLNVLQSDNAELVHFLEKSNSSALTESQNKVLTLKDNGWFFAAFGAFCFLLLFIKNGLFVFIFCLMFTTQAFAGFFFDADQEGALLFSSKEYQKAAQKFKNPEWKASAYYRAGDYENAAQTFSQNNDLTSLYNKANALAKGGKIPQAIELYEKVLKQDPLHEDAKFNLEYLKKMLEKQQQDQKSENKREENPQDQNQQNNQNTAEENQNNDDKTEAPQDAEDQDENQKNSENRQQQSSADQSDEEPQEQSQNKNNPENNSQNDFAREQQKTPQARAKEQQAEEYNETVQAREQQFREIKDDPGGLLRAFIKQEYLKNRYGKQQ